MADGASPPMRTSRPQIPGRFLPISDVRRRRESATLSGELPVSPADRTRAAAECALGNLNAMENKLAEAQEHYVKSATMGVGGRAGLYPAAIKAAINYAFGQGVPRDLGRLKTCSPKQEAPAQQRALLCP